VKLMSVDFDDRDLARLIALEHIASVAALIAACNLARLDRVRPSVAVAQIRSATEGSIYDSATMAKGVRESVRAHLKRLFDDVERMAIHADKHSVL
jgi:hypothetical protein